MRKVLLTVVGLAGLALLCGSGEMLAQTQPVPSTGNTVDADAADSRLQGMQTRDTGGSNPGVSFGTSGVVGSGPAGTTTGTTSTSSTSSTSGASTQALQQEVVQLRQQVAQLLP